jgi:hypothetical protein
MSAREMLKRDIDFMPDDVISVFSTIWSFKKELLEIPNAETIEAMEECLNGNTYTFTTFEEMLQAARELDDEDDETV